MFEEMTVGEMLKDLRSVKVPQETRTFINQARVVFETNGSVPTQTQMKLKGICQRYSRQLKELHESRERARCTNGRLKLGLSKEDIGKRVAERKKLLAERQNDVGF